MPQTRPAPPPSPQDWCAIDFGTSNSAVVVPTAAGLSLVPLEDGLSTLPTCVFYLAEGPQLHTLPRRFGRAAIATYVEGVDGRLMRSMKSVLGSGLMDQHTDIGAGRSVSFFEVIATYLAHLKSLAEAHAAHRLRRVVLGRPVFFVDDDAAQDAQAQATLEDAARSVGFDEVGFQFEPIAAAFDYEAQIDREQLALVADIGGGTSDFSVVRVGPAARARQDRRSDVLANHGVHIAGTDFDRRVELATILRELGYGAYGPAEGGRPAREVPSRVYFDLATWHLINSIYRPQRIQELRAMRVNYAQPEHHRRLMTVVSEHYGHDLLGRAEQAKIEAAGGDTAHIDLDLVERKLHCALSPVQLETALGEDLKRIVATALDTVRMAGLGAGDIHALYFTGGSTGLNLLTDALAAAFPGAVRVQGERLASVAMGLGLDAQRRYASL